MLSRFRGSLPPVLLKTLVRSQIRIMGIGSHVSDDDPERIAKALAEAAEGHTPSRVPTAPLWSEVLASDSEAIIKSERNAKQLSSAEASERASRGEPVPPGGVVLDPGATVGDDIASLRAHTIKVLAEEAFVERVVYVPPEQEERGGDSGQKKEKEVKAKEK